MNDDCYWLLRAYNFGSLFIMPDEIIYILCKELASKPILKLFDSIELNNRSKNTIGRIKYNSKTNKLIYIHNNCLHTYDLNAKNKKFDEHNNSYVIYNPIFNDCTINESYNNDEKLIVVLRNSIALLNLNKYSINDYIHVSECAWNEITWKSICYLNGSLYLIYNDNKIIKINNGLRNHKCVYIHSSNLCSINCISSLNVLFFSDTFGNILIYDLKTKLIISSKCSKNAIIYIKISMDNIIYVTKDKCIGIIKFSVDPFKLNTNKLIISGRSDMINISIIDNKYIMMSLMNGIIIYNFDGIIIKIIENSNYAIYLKKINKLAILYDNKINLYKLKL